MPGGALPGLSQERESHRLCTSWQVGLGRRIMVTFWSKRVLVDAAWCGLCLWEEPTSVTCQPRGRAPGAPSLGPASRA